MNLVFFLSGGLVGAFCTFLVLAVVGAMIRRR